MSFAAAERIFLAAVAHPAHERDAVVDEACAGDAALREMVLELLAHDAQAHPMFRDPPGDAVRAVTSSFFDDPLGTASDHPTRIASYRLIRQLQEGGFGVVYLAEQDNPRRTVALKLLRAPLASGQTLRRFEYEGLVLARLQHPGIAQIYEAGVAEIPLRTAGGEPTTLRQPFIAIEYIDGPNLVTFADSPPSGRPPLSIRERFELFAKICDTVQYAHQRGVIHRDLKPDNILVAQAAHTPHTPDAQPKILDFGVARVLDADPDLTLVITSPGQIVGTLAYMSPEQVSGKSDLVDTRSDVYSLGVILYQLLAGHLPYSLSGRSFHEAVQIIQNQAPSPLEISDRSLRSDAQAIIATALAKDRERRYGSAADLAADLRRCLNAEPIAAKRDSGWYIVRKTVRRHRVPISVAALFVILLVASSIAGWSLYAFGKRSQARAEALLRDSYVLNARALRAGDSIGRRFEAMEALRKAAAIRPAPDLRDEAIACLTLTDFEFERSLPPGRLASARGLRKIDRVAIAPGAGLVTVVDIETEREIASLPGPDATPIWMLFSEDGEYLGVRYKEADSDAPLWIWRVADATPVFRFEGSLHARGFQFGNTSGSPWLAFLDNDTVRVVDLPSGTPRSSFQVHPHSYVLELDRSGTRAMVGGHAYVPLRIYDVATGKMLAENTLKSAIHSAAWSADGSTLVCGSRDFDIYVLDPSSGSLIRTISGHRATVADVAIGGNDTIISVGWDNSTRSFNLHTGQPMLAPMRGVECVGFDGDRLALWSQRSLRFMRFVDDSPRTILYARGPLGAVSAMDFSADSRYMAVGGEHGIERWDLETGVPTLISEMETRCVFFAGSSSSIAAVTGAEVARWTVKADSTISAPEVVWKAGAHCWASPHDGGRSMVVSTTAVVNLVNLADGTHRKLCDGFRGCERPLISADSRWLFTGNWRGDAARLFDLASQNSETPCIHFNDSSVRATMNAASTMLAVSLPGRCHIYTFPNWRSARTVQWTSGDQRLAGGSAFSPDGSLLAITLPPDSTRLINPATGQTLATLSSPDSLGQADLRFSPDGKRLYVITIEREILVWDLEKLRSSLNAEGFEW